MDTPAESAHDALATWEQMWVRIVLALAIASIMVLKKCKIASKIR